jgi:heptosyltransferase-2
MVNKGTEEVLLHHPCIRKLWIYDRKLAKKNVFSSIRYHKRLIAQLRSENYQVVIDFTHGDRAAFLASMTGALNRITYRDSSSLSRILMTHIIDLDPCEYHIVDYQLKSLNIFGLDNFWRDLNLHVPKDVQKKADTFISGSGIERDALKVAIHPGARTKLRQWRPERFAQIASRLRDRYQAAIILVGGPGEDVLLEAVERHMRFGASFKSTGLSLLELGALLSRCQLFIGNDSAPGHIAAAVNCPTLSLFGPTFPHMWKPLNPKGDVLFKNVPCCGCRQENCIRPEMNCMNLIEVDEGWEKMERLLISLQLK